jgi:hypothetical protein
VSVDTDRVRALDGPTTFREICYFNTDRIVGNKDGDTSADGKDAVSINADNRRQRH